MPIAAAQWGKAQGLLTPDRDLLSYTQRTRSPLAGVPIKHGWAVIAGHCHTQKTVPWLRIAPRSSQSPGTAVCSMIRWVMKHAEVVEQKRSFGLFQLLSRAQGGLTRGRWMGTCRSLHAAGALPQSSMRRWEAGTVCADKTSSLLQAGHGL